MRHIISFSVSALLSITACGSSESGSDPSAMSAEGSTGSMTSGQGSTGEPMTAGDSASADSTGAQMTTTQGSMETSDAGSTSEGPSEDSSGGFDDDSSTGVSAAPQLCITVDQLNGHFYIRAEGQSQVLWSTDSAYAGTDADASGDCSEFGDGYTCCHEEMFIGGAAFEENLDLSFGPVEGHVTPDSRGVVYDASELVEIFGEYQPE